MREILFRGKRVDNGEWIYGYYVHQYGAYMIYPEEGSAYNNDEYYHVIPETVGQYTGLTDKNGKKIFEGDIVKTKEFGRDNGTMNFNDFDYFEIAFANGIFKMRKSARSFTTAYIDTRNEHYEVIGNIYDNPELLED